ncbi:MAG: peptidoglycan endopeptidase [Phascolarctobacterium sp.]
MNQGERIARDAFSWLGTPHINGAKVKGVGVDCGMLLIGCLEGAGAIGKDSIEIAPYSNEWHLHHSEEWFKWYVEQYCYEVSFDDIQAGDFLLYQFGRSVMVAYTLVMILSSTQLLTRALLWRLDDVMFLDAKGNSRLRHVYRFKGGD